MSNYAKHLVASQKEPLDSQMSKNNAGGYSYTMDNWACLERFLILGTEGGTYYVNERSLTRANIASLSSCLDENFQRAIDLIVNISSQGRAYKNSPAILALAIAASHSNISCRQYALANLNKVCRIGTHLFEFAEYCKSLRGWGSSLRSGIANWYNSMPASKLAYQVEKYPSRVVTEGQSNSRWSHKDLLRKSHPVGDEVHNSIYGYITKGSDCDVPLFTYLKSIRSCTNAQSVAKIIRNARENNVQITWEMIPTEFGSSQEVWSELLHNTPPMALLRVLNRMTAYGVLNSDRQLILSKLRDLDSFKKNRVHPIHAFIANKQYRVGHGNAGKLTWKPDNQIMEILNGLFYDLFANVDKIEGHTLLALDVSGSMSMGTLGKVPLTAAEGAALMAMVSARKADSYEVFAFTNIFKSLNINPSMSLEEIIKQTSKLNFGPTDCAIPMIHALNNKMKVDNFCIYTDNETWYGNIHPYTALQNYRKQYGRGKLVVCGMTATQFSIANPSDRQCLDVVGFDASTPQLIGEFCNGLI